MKLKDLLKKKLTKKEYELMPSSFDVVGDIAIFAEFPKELSKKEKLVGETLLRQYPNVKVVCKKIRKYSGKYRTAKLKIIAGENRKETTHVENGTRIMLDVEKVYFSPRSGTERRRISNLVKENENVLVMFAGAGPYTVQIAKKARKVTAIEANPVAHKYALINLKLNKITNSMVLKGDVKKIVPKLKEKFDRIVMPLPKKAIKYLGTALKAANKNSTIHLYSFADDEEFEQKKKEIADICTKSKRKCSILDIVKAGEYAPHVHRICIDIRIE